MSGREASACAVGGDGAPYDGGASPALRWALTAIVLTNLAFVHATEDASLTWLAPLYVLALCAHRLARLTEQRWYRWTWNAVVVAVAAWLVRGTLSSHAGDLLENGLRLAAVCQVHVLANLGRRQSPDLLFFNSFLIAVVTSFLTQDAVYSVVFPVYAVCLVVGLSLRASPDARGPAARRVVLQAVVRSAAVLAVTGGAFLVLPRDFQRRGLIVQSLAEGPAALQVGFSETVRLDRTTTPVAGGAVVFRVRSDDGAGVEPPTHWRGATKLTFDGKPWRTGPSSGLPGGKWRMLGPRVLVRSAADGPRWEVELADPSAGIAFTPLDVGCIRFTSTDPLDVAPLGDGTVRFPTREDDRVTAPFSYLVEAAPPAQCGGAISADPGDDLAPALDVLPRARVAAAERQATDVRRSLPDDAPQREVVEALREHLASRTDYGLPGADGSATTLTEFVEGRGGGHCEHFASALVLMLRSQRIPARLVTGFASDEWDPAAGVLTVRQRHAHAWVEVLDPAAGWVTVDPTPAGGREGASSPAWHERLRDRLAGIWTSIVVFDDGARERALAWFSDLPSLTAGIASEHPVAGGAAAALLLVLVLLRRAARRRRVPAAVRSYAASLRRAGMITGPAETPRETLDRACTQGVSGDALAALAAATAAHEASRFAARVTE